MDPSPIPHALDVLVLDALASLGTAVVVVRDGRIVFANPAYCDLTGYPEEELRALARPLVPGNHLTHRYVRGTQERAPAMALVRKDGTRTRVQATSVRTDGNVIWLVRAERRPDEELQQALSLVSATLDSSSDGILAVDKRGVITSFNHRFLEMWDLPESIIGSRDFDILLPVAIQKFDDPEGFLARIRDLYATEEDATDTLELRDGRTMERSSRIRRIGDEIVGCLWSFHDITEWRETVDALRRNEETFRRMFAENPIPMWVYDIDSLAFLAVNESAVATYGFSREEFLGMTIAETRPPEDVPRLLENVEQARRRMQLSGEWRHRTRNGEIIDVAISSHTIEFAGREARLVMARDITAQKRAEAALRAGEERIRDLYEDADRQVQQLAALHEIDVAITSDHDLDRTLNVLLERVVTQLRVDAAGVLLYNDRARMLEFGAGVGFRTGGIARSQVRRGEGYAGSIDLDRRTLHVPNLKESPGFSRASLLAGEDFLSYFAVALVSKGRFRGVLELFNRSPLDLGPGWRSFLEALATQAAIAIDNAKLVENLRTSNAELAVAYDTTLEGWSRALDLRDKETEGHCQRVTGMSVLLGRHMRLGADDLVHIRRGALLHDIGKMAIPDAILQKTGSLTPEEWTIMRRHPRYAYQLLSPIPYLRPALDIPYAHHEKWDGSGYPRGLRGEQIPFFARIFAITDVWDSLRSDRPYRKAWSEERVIDHIVELAGTHLDPAVVEAFLQMGPKD